MPVVGVLLAGCSGSSAGTTTCGKLSELSFDEQGDVIIKMIQEHGLDPYSNVVGPAVVESQVQQFCGMPGGALAHATATQNVSSPIEDGVDWDSLTAK